jgi:diaminohydroxyphosphoribosylaminopyrimidine deaminase/5-amino-6-(5-phosphoribosylamino)uracil reductase
MYINEKYMLRCLDLAILGKGSVSPNPMVGCVIVHNDRIVAEGFHREYGGPHAEVNAINAVSNDELLKECTLYVNLEPCAHHGLTPPCADLIIQKKIPGVVVGAIDPFSKVAGKGIEKMRKAGIEVVSDVLKNECLELNKRFYTYHTIKRPYIILKWAQTMDGFMDIERNAESYGEPVWITGDTALRLVHKIRSEEDAILVGTNTAERDNPFLTVRNWKGKNPLRLVIDKNLRLSKDLNLFKPDTQTIIINSKSEFEKGSVSYVKIDFEADITDQILDILYRRRILSLIVEGGKQLLETFITKKSWDEAHIFIGNKFFFEGIRAPSVKGQLSAEELLDNDRLKIFINTT